MARPARLPRERAWRYVPRALLWGTPALLLAAHGLAPASWPRGANADTSAGEAAQVAGLARAIGPRQATPLPQPPGADTLRVMALGDPVALSRFISLWLQSREVGVDGPLALRELDYPALLGWLERCLVLDPTRDDLVALAARVYAEVPDPARARAAIDFVRRQFAQAPARRWPYLAHVTVLARHRLDDLGLARALSRELRERTLPGEAPRWAREMELTVLGAQGEWEAARELAGALLVEGGPREGAELRFLERYLARLPHPRRETGAGMATDPGVAPPGAKGNTR